MNETEIRQTLFQLLANIAPDTEPEKLQPDDDIRKKLGLDSFDALQFVVAIDEHYGIEIPEEDYGKITTIRLLTAYIEDRNKQDH